MKLGTELAPDTKPLGECLTREADGNILTVDSCWRCMSICACQFWWRDMTSIRLAEMAIPQPHVVGDSRWWPWCQSEEKRSKLFVRVNKSKSWSPRVIYREAMMAYELVIFGWHMFELSLSSFLFFLDMIEIISSVLSVFSVRQGFFGIAFDCIDIFWW